MANKAINRSDIVRKLSEKHHMRLIFAEKLVRSIFGRISDGLINKQRVELRGIGAFELRHRAARKARNPKTRQWVMTKEKYAIHYKPGKDMRQKIMDSVK